MTRIEITQEDDTGRVIVQITGPYSKSSAFGLLEVAKDMIREMIAEKQQRAAVVDTERVN